MTDNVEKLRAILEELDEEKLAEMDDEEVLKLRKEMNPYGRIIEGSDKFLTFSYTDLREKYLKNLLMTSFIGFVNRMNAEWAVPEGFPVVHPYDYVRDPSLMPNPEEYDDPKAKAELEENIKHMEKRIAVQEFIEYMFQFNPDEHVRSAYRPHEEDKSRKPVKTPAAQRAIRHLRKVDKAFNAKMQEKELKEELAQSIEVLESSDSAESTGTVKEAPSDSAEAVPSTEEERNSVERYTTEMIPPHDVFERWNRYLEVNYDKLREVTNDLYCMKPDFDRAICPHSWHDTLDEADAYINKHKNELIVELHKAHSGKWNFFAPTEKVRKTTRYFNDETVILEEMTKQLEQDAKLGQDLMKKRIKKKKKKNIAEDGPDAEGFAKWKSQNSTLRDLGAWENKNETGMADDDAPEDSVQVDVFSFSEGGRKLKKSSFYTQAEAPTMPKAS